VIATDVGSLRDDIIEHETGFLCRPEDSADLARAIRDYFLSPVYRDLEHDRGRIRRFAVERNSWTKVGEILKGVYERALGE
jgi:glycosyltransferase involved in cell wall biosynthesis